MHTVIIIPARLGSTRFPKKVLADLCGKPLIQHVYDRAMLCKEAKEVIIATDSQEVARVIRDAGGKAVMTSPDHTSGTDRIAEVARTVEADIIVNVQGDEPLIEPAIIQSVIQLLIDDPQAQMGTAAVRITNDEAARDPNVVKAAIAADGHALYFSRSPIPYHRDAWSGAGQVSAEGATLYKHIGIYSYRKHALMKLSALPPSPLEEAEKLEQLRALENGMRIAVAVVEADTPGVDTPEDLETVKRLLE